MAVAEHKPLTIGGRDILPGERVTIDLPVAGLYTHAPVTMPVQVIRGKKPGPTLFVAAALHGDEINGVEIVRRLLKLPRMKSLRGTLIAVPIVNVFGFLNRERYTPDRRDLNRSFPGSAKGSVAGRLAHLFVNEIVNQADCGIDLHTAAIHRDNLPQIRADLKNAHVRGLAEAFGAPIMIDANLREGSLREYAYRQGVPMLLYEAGEALRFDEVCVRAGLRGILRVMGKLGMLPSKSQPNASAETVLAQSSQWLRAPCSGIVRFNSKLGDRVTKGQALGIVGDPFGEREEAVESPINGIVIGRANLPLANEGEALFHVAAFESSKAALKQVEAFQSQLEPVGQGLLPEEPPIA